MGGNVLDRRRELSIAHLILLNGIAAIVNLLIGTLTNNKLNYIAAGFGIVVVIFLFHLL